MPSSNDGFTIKRVLERALHALHCVNNVYATDRPDALVEKGVDTNLYWKIDETLAIAELTALIDIFPANGRVAVEADGIEVFGVGLGTIFQTQRSCHVVGRHARADNPARYDEIMKFPVVKGRDLNNRRVKVYVVADDDAGVPVE